MSNPIEEGQAKVSVGGFLPEVEATLGVLESRNVVQRIWRRDYTVWKPEPAEISNRLGWLNIVEAMHERVPVLESFAQDVRASGFRHVVLLGMGGSSLGPEVLRRAFGHAEGYPELVVLDSTVPEWVNAATEGIDPASTLFLVSSKSGTTIEPLLLLRHFEAVVESAVGDYRVGRRFAAITDPGTPLNSQAIDEGFRRAFLNPTDIGGRYSVLSYFGLVPAALCGIRVDELLERASQMRERCSSGVPLTENPGALLGVVMGVLALRGRDKLTLVATPSMAGFGLWVEQLIAESTGKEGKGIIPVAGEPLVDPGRYGDDRFFVYIRLDEDDCAETDAAVEGIRASGHPVATLEMKDKYDLGAEFFRWEFATAVAGAILGINPFDQPDVKAAKDAAEHALNGFSKTGRLPASKPSVPVSGLFGEARGGRYLAVMAYLRETPEVEKAVEEFRRSVIEEYSIATTFGYGPRFLHSTGQLHKGGPRKGLFLQITQEPAKDLPVPGEPYTFGVVADAQALGDLRALVARGRPVASMRLAGGKSLDADYLSPVLARK